MTQIQLSGFTSPEKIIVWNWCILTLTMKVLIFLHMKFVIILPTITQVCLTLQGLIR
jgi:hypothetical protein